MLLPFFCFESEFNKNFSDFFIIEIKAKKAQKPCTKILFKSMFSL